MNHEPAALPLDALGRLHYACSLALSDMGYPGFGCQFHLEIDGRLDPAALQQALRRWFLRYPWLGARIAGGWRGLRGPLRWEPCSRAPRLNTIRLADDQPATRLRELERLCWSPLDIDGGRPIECFLLRAEQGNDTLVLHYDHTLVGDAAAMSLLVGELDRWSEVADDRIEAAEVERDQGADYLLRHSRWKRWRSAWKLVRSCDLSRRALRLGQAGWEEQADRCRIDMIDLDPAQTNAFDARSRQASGLGNPSMALLTCVFRALAASAPAEDPRFMPMVGVGYSLRPSRVDGGLFGSVGAEAGIAVELDQLEDWEAACRELSSQLRGHIRQGMDLGAMQLARAGSFFLPTMRKHFRKRMGGLSLGYGFFKSQQSSFLGKPVRRVRHFLTPFSPPGLSVSGTLHDDRLEVIVGTGRKFVTSQQAGLFVDRLREELVG